MIHFQFSLCTRRALVVRGGGAFRGRTRTLASKYTVTLRRQYYIFQARFVWKVGKGAKIITIKYHTLPRIPKKVTNSQLDTTNESQEVSPFPAGDHKARINRRTQRHSKHKTEKT